jgi:DNA-binding NarL/FixJ family response regulator
MLTVDSGGTRMKASGRISVVVADDTEDIRDLVELSLDIDGRFTIVDEVADGRAAVDACRRRQPDAIVLDLAMPVMSGNRAVPLIADVSPRTAIVVYSAQYTPDDVAALMAAGARAVVSKNARPAQLADMVATAVASQHS